MAEGRTLGLGRQCDSAYPDGRRANRHHARSVNRSPAAVGRSPPSPYWRFRCPIVTALPTWPVHWSPRSLRFGNEAHSREAEQRHLTLCSPYSKTTRGHSSATTRVPRLFTCSSPI